MDDEVDLRQYLSVLWRRRYHLLAVTAFVTLAGGLFSFVVPPTYEAITVIQLSEHSASAYATPPSAAQVLVTPTFLDAVAKAAGGLTGRDLQKLVAVEAVRDTKMIRVRVRHRDPQRAKDIADAFGRSFIARASESVLEKRTAIQQRLDAVTSQLNEVQRILQLTRETLVRLQQGGTLAAEDRGFIRTSTLIALGLAEDQYRAWKDVEKNLAFELITLDAPAVIGSPIVPLVPVAPRKVVNIVLSAMLGVIVGIVLVFVLEFADATRRLAPAGPAAALSGGGKEPGG